MPCCSSQIASEGAGRERTHFVTHSTFMKTLTSLFAAAVGSALFASVFPAQAAEREVPLNQGWGFHREEAQEASPPNGSAVSGTFDDSGWERVSLPHAARLDSPYLGDKFFKGICWYRRVIP